MTSSPMQTGHLLLSTTLVTALLLQLLLPPPAAQGGGPSIARPGHSTASHGSWVEVNRTQLLLNARGVLNIIPPGVVPMAVIKGNGYGHGLLTAASAFEEGGWSEFGVAEIREGVQLRQEGYYQNVTVLYQPPDADLAELAAVVTEYSLQLAVESADFVERLCQHLGDSRALPVHLIVSTDKVREGVRLYDAPGVVEAIGRCGRMRLRGVYTHKGNRGRFLGFAEELRTRGVTPELLHFASSDHLLEGDTHLGMVRMGGALYYGSGKYDLPPGVRGALRWLARVAAVKRVFQGEKIGYKGSIAQKNYTVAVINAGYYDGLVEARGVYIRDTRCPIFEVGTSMNVNLVDVTELEGGVAVGDLVVIADTGRGLYNVHENNTASIPPHLLRVVVH